jgi:hypothetical protein
MPMIASAIDQSLLLTLIAQARNGDPIAPSDFASIVLYDLRELEQRANVPIRAAELEPHSPQLQAYMRRSLDVLRSLLEMGLTPENALFWFGAFRVVELNDKRPIDALSEECANIVIQSLRSVFVLHFDELGTHYERMREDTQSVQQDLFRDIRMMSAEDAANCMGLHDERLTTLDLARALEKTKRAIYIMKDREPYFPACQFDMRGPKKIIADLIRTLSPYRSSWEIIVWLWGSNGWLSGASPMDLLDSKPNLVLHAAFQEVAEDAE